MTVSMTTMGDDGGRDGCRRCRDDVRSTTIGAMRDGTMGVAGRAGMMGVYPSMCQVMMVRWVVYDVDGMGQGDGVVSRWVTVRVTTMHDGTMTTMQMKCRQQMQQMGANGWQMQCCISG